MGSMLSGAADIYGAIVGGAQESQAALQEWNANRALAQYGARTANLKGAQEAADIRARGTQVGESQKLAYASNNVDASYGTAAAVQSDTAAQAELDAQTAKNNAAREAWGFKVQEEQAHRQYQSRINAAQNKSAGSFLTGGGKLVSGAMSLGGS